MKKILILVLCLMLVPAYAYASGEKSFSELVGFSVSDIVRISIRSGSSGRTVVSIEDADIIKEICACFEEGRFAPVDTTVGGGRGGWLYNIRLYTDIFEDHVFEYTLSTGTSCIDGVWYELEDESKLSETVEKYMNDPFSYDGIKVSSGTPAANSEIIIKPNEKTITAYGMELDMGTPALIRDDRMFVPLRFIAEALGAEVVWNSDEQTVFIKHGGTEIKITIGSKSVIANGRESTMDVAPFISEDRTYVPLRFIAELTGAEVVWKAGKREAVINRVF